MHPNCIEGKEKWKNGVPTGCCCGLLTCKVYSEEQDSVLEAYKVWRYENVHLGKDIIAVEDNIQRFEQAISSDSQRLIYVVTEVEKNEIKQALQYKSNKKADLEMALYDLKIKEKTGEYLAKQHSDINLNRTMERITFWQHTINYILYTTAIVQIIILGLGVFE